MTLCSVHNKITHVCCGGRTSQGESNQKTVIHYLSNKQSSHLYTWHNYHQHLHTYRSWNPFCSMFRQLQHFYKAWNSKYIKQCLSIYEKCSLSLLTYTLTNLYILIYDLPNYRSVPIFFVVFSINSDTFINIWKRKHNNHQQEPTNKKMVSMLSSLKVIKIVEKLE